MLAARKESVNLRERNARSCRFVRQLSCQLVPALRGNRTRQAVIFHHPTDVQVLDANPSRLTHERATQMMQMVVTDEALSGEAAGKAEAQATFRTSNGSPAEVGFLGSAFAGSRFTLPTSS